MGDVFFRFTEPVSSAMRFYFMAGWPYLDEDRVLRSAHVYDRQSVADIGTWDGILIDQLRREQILLNDEFLVHLELADSGPWRVVKVSRLSDDPPVYFHADPGVDESKILYRCVADLARSGLALDEVLLTVIHADNFLRAYAFTWKALISRMMQKALSG